MDSTITPAHTAHLLRELADRLDHATPVPDLSVYVSLCVGGYRQDTEPERVAAVDTLATGLGLTAGAAVSVGSSWDHKATHDPHPRFHLTVRTHIASPRRCACGANCDHTTTATAA